jgi:hypothetical protein
MNEAFRTDGEAITFRVMQFETNIGSSEDGYQRLACRWEADVLAFRRTNGLWTPFVKRKDDLRLCGNRGECFSPH